MAESQEARRRRMVKRLALIKTRHAVLKARYAKEAFGDVQPEDDDEDEDREMGSVIRDDD